MSFFCFQMVLSILQQCSLKGRLWLSHMSNSETVEKLGIKKLSEVFLSVNHWAVVPQTNIGSRQPHSSFSFFNEMLTTTNTVLIIWMKKAIKLELNSHCKANSGKWPIEALWSLSGLLRWALPKANISFSEQGLLSAGSRKISNMKYTSINTLHFYLWEAISKQLFIAGSLLWQHYCQVSGRISVANFFPNASFQL